MAYVYVPKEGTVFTDGEVVLDLRGKHPATITKVESLGGRDALTFLGAKIAEPHREYSSVQAVPGWPPRHLVADKVVDAIGATLQPTAKTWNEDAYELLLGYRVTKVDKSVRTGVRVTYVVDGTTYRATFPVAIALCPQGQNQDRCLDDAMNKLSHGPHPGHDTIE